MGSCKPLLPWGKSSIIGHLVDLWKSLPCAQIAPATDPANRELRDALEVVGFDSTRCILNERAGEGMFSTLRRAGEWRGWNDGISHVAIALCDQPCILLETLRELLDSVKRDPLALWQPRYGDRNGHPVVLPMDDLRAIPHAPEGNLRDFLRAHGSRRRQVPVSDPGVLIDLDTPMDYEQHCPPTLVL